MSPWLVVMFLAGVACLFAAMRDERRNGGHLSFDDHTAMPLPVANR